MIIFQGEKRNPAKLVGIFLGFIGIVIIITEFQFAAFLDSEQVKLEMIAPEVIAVRHLYKRGQILKVKFSK